MSQYTLRIHDCGMKVTYARVAMALNFAAKRLVQIK
jgi:hypothetical protein